MFLTKLLLATLTATAPEPAHVSVVPLGLRIEMDLPDTTSRIMTREVEEILAPLELRIVTVPPSKRAAATVVVRERPAVARIAGCRRDLHDHRLALTALDRALVVLWTDQVTRAARGDWDSDEIHGLRESELGRALGRVLAHELGHLLLGLREHQTSGLMRGSFRHRELTGRRSRTMSLTVSSPDMLEDYRMRLHHFLGGAGALPTHRLAPALPPN